MNGPLDELFRVRTNGNGYVDQEWNDVLLNEILELLNQGRVREELCEPSPTHPGGWGTRRFRALESGEIYEYTGPWERGGPRFRKIGPD